MTPRAIACTLSVALMLAGCASQPPAPPSPVQIQRDKCGNNLRNPMGLPSDVVLNVAMTDPAAYAHMLMDYYDKNPQCRL
jgi:nitrous oxide reductase accessory protein NosL